jgi:hypothetical protein
VCKFSSLLEITLKVFPGGWKGNMKMHRVNFAKFFCNKVLC